MDFLTVICIVSLSVVANVALRYLLITRLYGDRFGASGDASNHLEMIRSLKEKWILRKISKYEIPNFLSYPLLFHQYSTIFSKKALEQRSYLPNFFLYILFSCVYGAVVLWLGVRGLVELTPLNVVLLLSFQFLSQTNLSFVGDNINYLKLSGRYLSREAFNYYCLFMVLSMEMSGQVEFTALSVVFLALGMLASTIGRQLTIWVSIVFSALAMSWQPLLIFVLAFLLAWSISPFRFIRSFINTLGYTTIYKNYMKKYNLANMDKVVNVRALIQALSKGQMKQVLYLMYAKEPFRLFIEFPQILLLLTASILFYDEFSTQHFAFLITILAVYILTNTYRFMHLGEGFRYLEYSLITYTPFVLLYSVPDMEAYAWPVLGIFYGLTLLGFLLTWYFDIRGKQTAVQDKQPLVEAIDALKLGKGDVVFPVSFMLAREITARSEANSFWWQPGGISQPAMYEEYFEFYPYLCTNWKHIFTKHRVTHVMVDKKALERFNSMAENKYDLESMTQVFENEKYAGYSVPESYYLSADA